MPPFFQDSSDRRPIWQAMQMLFMDTHEERELMNIARICAASKYTLSELEAILYDEVFPACRRNLLILPAPGWGRIRPNELAERIRKKHRHGRPRLLLFRHQVNRWWCCLEAEIARLRSQSAVGSEYTEGVA